jgi:hypothetical protein
MRQSWVGSPMKLFRRTPSFKMESYLFTKYHKKGKPKIEVP